MLVAAVLWTVLAACGLAWPDGRPMLLFCPVAALQVDPALIAEQERQRALQGRVRDLEIALLERPYCAPPQPGPEQEPEPPSIEDAIRRGDVQALEGCWELDSDYQLEDEQTGEVFGARAWEVCFSDDGSGDQTLSVTEGSLCQSRVNASFPDLSTVTFRDATDLRCRGGRWGFVYARSTTCQLGDDGKAQCITNDIRNPEFVQPVTLRRKR